jgi:phosphatidylglycerophosphate synthase
MKNLNKVTLEHTLRALSSPANLMTLSRALAAFAFLSPSVTVRTLAVIWAGISDMLDGWMARRLHQNDSFGAALDPILDKFFMVFALVVLLTEDKMGSYELTALFARDIMVLFFGLYLALTGHWKNWTLRAPRLGKIFTGLQMLVLFALCIDLAPPAYTYDLFYLLGCLMLVELGCSLKPPKKTQSS